MKNNHFLRFSTILLLDLSLLSYSSANSNLPDFTMVKNHGVQGFYLGNSKVADIDKDGKKDIIIAGSINNVSAPDGSGRIRIYRNISTKPGHIEFELFQEISETVGNINDNYSRVNLVTGDYDNDGDVDLFATFYGFTDQKPIVGTNKDGKFTVKTFPDGGGHIELADLNKDGYLEFINLSRGPFYYSWNGSTWVGKQSNFSHSLGSGDLAVGDFNGDSWIDIVAGGNSGGTFGNHRAKSECFSQINLNKKGEIDPSPHAILSTFGGDKGGNSIDNGMDNGSYAIDDFDLDGTTDIAFAGSHEGFSGPKGTGWIHYDFIVLYNKDGTGKNFKRWECADGGAGNTSIQNITSGDFTGDGYPDIFFMGHHRDPNKPGYYMYESRLYVNNKGNGFIEIHEDLPDLGRGHGVFADFDGNGKVELFFHGAEIPFHSNGYNGVDVNNTSTIKAYLYKNGGETSIENPSKNGTKKNMENSFLTIVDDKIYFNTLSLLNKKAQIKILNSFGQVLSEQLHTIKDLSLPLKFSYISHGIYIYHIKIENLVITRKNIAFF